MRGGEYAVEDDRDVGEKFGNNVEGAPHSAQNELDCCVSFAHEIQTDGNSRLSNQY